MSLDLDKKIVALCLQHGDLVANRDLSSSHLKTHYKKMYKMLQDYYTKHQRLPSFEIFEARLREIKEKVFTTDVNADDIIIGLRTEMALVNKDDYPFLVEDIKNRSSSEKIQNSLPKAIKLFKEFKDIKGAIDVMQEIVTSVKANGEVEQIKRVDNAAFSTHVKDKYYKTKDDPTVAWGLRTGFQALDEATYGLSAGELLIIAARHGNGKSIWLLNAAVNMFRAGSNVVLVSLEMPWEQYSERFMSCYADVPTDGIKGGKLTPEQELRLEEAHKDLQERAAKGQKFTILDIPHTTVSNISAELNLIAEKHKPDVLAVDYLGIVKPSDSKLKDNEAQAAVVEEMRQLGRARKIPIMTAVQLNREPNRNKKTKGTERLSRSDVIGATADIVLQIEEVDPEEMMARLTDKTKIHVIKNRKGRAPFDFEVRKNFACAQFVDWSPVLAFATKR